MKHIIRTTAFTLILSTALMTSEAQADRQGGGTLMTAGSVRVDKWHEFDTRLIPTVIPDLNLADTATKPVREFVKFKSSQGDQVTFDYTWINGTNASAGQVTMNKARLTEEGAEIVKALIESRSTSGWERLK